MPLLSSRFSIWPGNRRLATHAALGVLLIASTAFSACTDADSQSAIQPGQVATGFVSTPFSQVSSEAEPNGSPITASPAVQVTPTEGPQSRLPLSTRVYFTNGGDLWQIPIAGGEAAPVLSSHSILGFAPSPDGEQVAVVYTSGSPEQQHLADYKADGTSVVDVTLKEAQANGVQSLAWSPTGDRVAVARQDGSIATITNDGTLTQIVGPSQNRFPGELSISPDGKTLLYLDPALPDRNTSLFTIPMDGGTPKLIVNGDEPPDPVIAATWLPDGSDIAYVQPTASSPQGTGDVFTVNVQNRQSALAVPSSQFAPVAGVAEMAFSRDGHWLAVTVYVPGKGGSTFGGLWLVNRETSATRQISVDDDRAVTDLWWANGTLLYRSVMATSGKLPQRYGGLGPYELYAVSPIDVQPTLRHKSD